MRRFRVYSAHAQGLADPIGEGCVFQNGKVAIVWLAAYTSITLYDTMADVAALHGPEGSQVVYVD